LAIRDAVFRGLIAYAHSDDTMRFYTSGSEAMRLTSTSLYTASGINVGIGTSSPNSYAGFSTLTLNNTSGGEIDFEKAGTVNGSIYNPSGGDNFAITAANVSGSLLLQSGGYSTRATLDSSGNLGLGVTPSAWSSASSPAFQLPNGAALFSRGGSTFLGQNFFYNSSDTGTYIADGFATLYNQASGQHQWFNAPSGTAGNAAPLTQAMTLTAAGDLLVGTTSSSYSSANRTVLALGSGSDGSLIDFQVSGETSDGYIYADGTNFTIENSNSGYIRFNTDASERARITSGGYSKFSNNGTYSGSAASYHEFYQTANATALLIRATDGSYSNDVLTINGDRVTTNSSYNLINAYNGAVSGQFIVRDSGNAVNTNNSYGAISDAKLKENVTDATPKLEKLSQVRVVNFNLIGQEQKQLGVIAQELEQIFPGMVDESPDRDQDGNDLGTTTKSVKYSVFVPMLVKAIQEQQAIIESLTARVSALEGN
jgi:hypothetical protein